MGVGIDRKWIELSPWFKPCTQPLLNRPLVGTLFLKSMTYHKEFPDTQTKKKFLLFSHYENSKLKYVLHVVSHAKNKSRNMMLWFMVTWKNRIKFLQISSCCRHNFISKHLLIFCCIKHWSLNNLFSLCNLLHYSTFISQSQFALNRISWTFFRK